MVPGLLQAEEYAPAVFSMRRPLLDDETIERRVTDRLSRRAVFERRPGPVAGFVMEEVVLQRPLGGRAVQRVQLGRLLRIGRLRTVELQVTPTDREEHPGNDGASTLLVPRERPQVAYTEVQGVQLESSHSGGEGGECVEVAVGQAIAHARDSKKPDGPRLDFASAEWAAFVGFAAGLWTTIARPPSGSTGAGKPSRSRRVSNSSSANVSFDRRTSSTASAVTPSPNPAERAQAREAPAMSASNSARVKAIAASNSAVTQYSLVSSTSSGMRVSRAAAFSTFSHASQRSAPGARPSTHARSLSSTEATQAGAPVQWTTSRRTSSGSSSTSWWNSAVCQPPGLGQRVTGNSRSSRTASNNAASSSGR
ncbi:DUF397 domain-containing protein [Actinacidiphila glaucinigra]|uniref:DUF397 domain-containing protein n=1 Tax=Actinacidiphila glaucinigra TaxID=235986 RepID=UPI0033ABC630